MNFLYNFDISQSYSYFIHAIYNIYSHCLYVKDIIIYPNLDNKPMDYKYNGKYYRIIYPSDKTNQDVFIPIAVIVKKDNEYLFDITQTYISILGPYGNFHGYPMTTNEILNYVKEKNNCQLDNNDLMIEVISEDIETYQFYKNQVPIIPENNI